MARGSPSSAAASVTSAAKFGSQSARSCVRIVFNMPNQQPTFTAYQTAAPISIGIQVSGMHATSSDGRYRYRDDRGWRVPCSTTNCPASRNSGKSEPPFTEARYTAQGQAARTAASIIKPSSLSPRSRPPGLMGRVVRSANAAEFNFNGPVQMAVSKRAAER